MKFIVSQDGQQIFTIGENNLINVAPVKDENTEITTYSVGIEGVSFGTFASKEAARRVLIGISKFLCGDDCYFAIPGDYGVM